MTQFLFCSDMEGVMEGSENQENASGSNDQRSEALNMSPRKHDEDIGTV